MKREPQRTCVGCRRVRPKAGLLRLVRQADGAVVVDRGGAAPGRGAYVCPMAECVAEILGRGRLAKAFRAKAEASAELMTLWKGLGGRVDKEVRGLWPRG